MRRIIWVLTLAAMGIVSSCGYDSSESYGDRAAAEANESSPEGDNEVGYPTGEDQLKEVETDNQDGTATDGPSVIVDDPTDTLGVE